MTRMQVISKAVLSGLGLYLVVRLQASIEYILAVSSNPATPVPVGARAACLAATLLVIAVIVVWFVLDNGWAARWLARHGEVLSRRDQGRSLVVSYRLAMLLVGLFLLPGAIETIARLLFILWPPNLREAFSWLINSGTLPPGLDWRISQWFHVITEGLKAALASYLVLGAPHFIRWQLHRSVAGLTLDPPSERNENES